jgi:hypothetical protein
MLVNLASEWTAGGVVEPLRLRLCLNCRERPVQLLRDAAALKSVADDVGDLVASNTDGDRAAERCWAVLVLWGGWRGGADQIAAWSWGDGVMQRADRRLPTSGHANGGVLSAACRRKAGTGRVLRGRDQR